MVANFNADLLDGRDASEFASYERTVVVSPVGSATQNGQALINTLNGISGAASESYPLFIEAGIYDLGSGSLQMKEHVDLEGAGDLKTIIVSTASSDSCNAGTAGTVREANNAELRLLIVRNTGTGRCSAGIANVNASPRLTQVTAESTGGEGSYHDGVYNENASPTMTNVTATASGGTNNFGRYIGVHNFNSSPTIRHSRLSGTTHSLYHTFGGTAKVALTQLAGTIRRDSALQCFNNYDENMAPKSCTP